MRRAAGLALIALSSGCGSTTSGEASAREPVTTTAAPLAPDPEHDEAYERCRTRIAEVRTRPHLAGAPDFERQRAEVLGRARGEPIELVREPKPAVLEPSLARRDAFSRLRALKQQFSADRPALRARVLREGYVYSADPQEALALVSLLTPQALFDEPKLFLQRGSSIFELDRKDGKEPHYLHASGRKAELLFGDRIALSRSELERPLHRDLRGVAHATGFDRAKISHRTEEAIVAELRFGGAWIRGLLAADGAKLELECLDATVAQRKRVEDWQQKDASRRRALAALRSAVDEQLAEALPFDRPRDEETAERDGHLRPAWRWAYTSGQSWFSFEEESYPVYDAKGRPHPPQVCVDFVLDSFERASGTWFAPRERGPGRVLGTLDFDSFGIKNRSGVLAFEKFAAESPELFEHMRFEPAQRIQFRERSRFFGFLVERAELFRPGDVIAIQGVKNDGLIHQHAILIEDTDPITGFPDALADQMRRPRRRTWEGIMAEAPLRSLLFRVRPRPSVLERVAPPR